MGTKFDAHTALEVSIGDSVIELCADLECELHAGSPMSFDDPGEPASVEIIKVGLMWEELTSVDPLNGKVRKTRKVHGAASSWFQQLIMDHADTEALLEQAPQRGDDD